MGKMLFFLSITFFLNIFTLHAQNEKTTPGVEENNAITGFTVEDNDFKWIMLLTGGWINIDTQNKIQIKSPILAVNYNTVEGVNTTGGIRYRHYFNPFHRLTFGPDLHYAYPRDQLSGVLNLDFEYKTNLDSAAIEVKFGRQIHQFNADIGPFANTLSTLLFQDNQLKLFEQDFINLDVHVNHHQQLKANLTFELSERWQLSNHPKLVNAEENKYSSNVPENIEIEDTSFPRHRAFTVTTYLEYKPFLKFQIIDGKKQPVSNSSPVFWIMFEKGFPDITGSVSDFDKLTLGFNHNIALAKKTNFIFYLEGGGFLNADQVYFMDFFHFPRNQAPFLLIDNEESLRLLDYYYYSTKRGYFKSNMILQLSDFLVGRFHWAREMGIYENLILNNLFTPDLNHYTEFGYGIDNIFKLIRIEIMASILDGRFNKFGARVGLIHELNF